MGTRAITRVYGVDAERNDDGELMSYEKNREFVQMYRQLDGYPEGHGLDLVEFLKQCNFMNGIASRKEFDGYVCNGAGGFGAQLIRHFKERWPEGNIYVQEFGIKESWFHVYEIGIDTVAGEFVYIKHDGEFMTSIEEFEDYIEEARS